MNVLATVAAIAVSLAGLARLTATDPKRRRAFRLAEPAPGRTGAAWAAVLLPGLMVPVWAGAAGFFVWLGASSVLGWAIAAAPPQRTVAARQRAQLWLLEARGRVDPLIRAARRGWGAWQRRAPDRTLAERVQELELEVAMLKARLGVAAEPADVVVELPRPGETVRASRARQG
jgi:hypothetical protein